MEHLYKRCPLFSKERYIQSITCTGAVLRLDKVDVPNMHYHTALWDSSKMTYPKALNLMMESNVRQYCREAASLALDMLMKLALFSRQGYCTALQARNPGINHRFMNRPDVNIINPKAQSPYGWILHWAARLTRLAAIPDFATFCPMSCQSVLQWGCWRDIWTGL